MTTENQRRRFSEYSNETLAIMSSLGARGPSGIETGAFHGRQGDDASIANAAGVVKWSSRRRRGRDAESPRGGRVAARPRPPRGYSAERSRRRRGRGRGRRVDIPRSGRGDAAAATRVVDACKSNRKRSSSLRVRSPAGERRVQGAHAPRDHARRPLHVPRGVHGARRDEPVHRGGDLLAQDPVPGVHRGGLGSGRRRCAARTSLGATAATPRRRLAPLEYPRGVAATGFSEYPRRAPRRRRDWPLGISTFYFAAAPRLAPRNIHVAPRRRRDWPLGISTSRPAAPP